MHIQCNTDFTTIPTQSIFIINRSYMTWSLPVGNLNSDMILSLQVRYAPHSLSSWNQVPGSTSQETTVKGPYPYCIITLYLPPPPPPFLPLSSLNAPCSSSSCVPVYPQWVSWPAPAVTSLWSIHSCGADEWEKEGRKGGKEIMQDKCIPFRYTCT